MSEREVKRSAKDGLVGRLGVLHFQGPKCVDQCCSQAFLAVTLGTVLLSSSLTQAGFGWNMWTLLQFAPTCMLLQFLLHVSFLALIILGHMIRCLITGICIFIFVHIARSQADIHMAIKFFLYIYIHIHTHIYIYIYAYILVGCRFTAINGLAVEVHNEKGKASFDFFQLLRGRGGF